jgi:hypothetical protein
MTRFLGPNQQVASHLGIDPKQPETLDQVFRTPGLWATIERTYSQVRWNFLTWERRTVDKPKTEFGLELQIGSADLLREVRYKPQVVDLNNETDVIQPSLLVVDHGVLPNRRLQAVGATSTEIVLTLQGDSSKGSPDLIRLPFSRETSVVIPSLQFKFPGF